MRELAIVKQARKLEAAKAARPPTILVAPKIDAEVIDAIVKQLEKVLRPLANLGEDYSVDDIARLCNVSKTTAMRIQTGRYYVGDAVRFRREEIDYYRKTGKRLETKR